MVVELIGALSIYHLLSNLGLLSHDVTTPLVLVTGTVPGSEVFVNITVEFWQANDCIVKSDLSGSPIIAEVVTGLVEDLQY